MKAVPLNAALGARIEGLNRADAMKPEVATFLNRALGDHQLLVVPGPPMTAARRCATSRRDLRRAVAPQLLRYKRDGEAPEVSPHGEHASWPDGAHRQDRHPVGGLAHRRIPTWRSRRAATALHCARRFPAAAAGPGSATCAPSTRRCPRRRRSASTACRAMHGYDTAARPQPPVAAHRRRRSPRRPTSMHPLVRTHPDTGAQGALPELQPARPHRRHGAWRRATRCSTSCSPWRAQPHASTTPTDWAVGDAVIWDNRATMHRVDVDYPMGERRIMQRVLIEGDKPF